MVRCARDTCGREASVELGYDPVEGALWLVDLAAAAAGVLVLCAGHADNLTVPDGWTVHDERDGVPRLWSFSPAVTAIEKDPVQPTRLDHARARRSTNVEVLGLFDPPADAALAVDGADVDPEIALDVETDGEIDGETPEGRSTLIPGVAGDASSDDLEVDSSTPLLARAFRASAG